MMMVSNTYMGSRTMKILTAISLVAVMALAVMSGCAPDRKGTAAVNRPPQVFIVNTPPDGATFSRNPELNWYATDGDGFIKLFRYAVLIDSNLKVNGQKVPVDVFVAQAASSQYNWTTLEVDLDHPRSTATVRLYANVDFPIDSFVTQYFFIQAEDDQGAVSETKWRRYARNDHYPNTHHRALEVYINAKDASSPMDGIVLNWEGADSLDWGRATPPLEFEWRLYGPFASNAPVYVNIVPENCTWDPVTRTYINCIDTKVLNLDALPPAIGDIPQPVAQSKGSNFANDPNDTWVTDQQTTIYNVFRDVPNITKTSQFKFLFWVRCRDDGFVPDPTPAFSQFFVVEALFEKGVAIFDETSFLRSSFWGPRDLNMMKGIYKDYIDGAMQEIVVGDYVPFDTAAITDTIQYPKASGRETDFFCVQRIRTFAIPPDRPKSYEPVKPKLTDILSHKVLLVTKDDADMSLREDVALNGLVSYAYFGMDMGASGWVMARNLGTSGMTQTTEPGAYTLSANFSRYFGISDVYHEGWSYYSVRNATMTPMQPVIWNEQFMGAFSLKPELFPDINVDLRLLVDRFRRLDDSTFLVADTTQPHDTHYFGGMPEVGAGTRTNQATALYLYNSRMGEASALHGKVMGVAQEVESMRSLAFMFTPLAIDTLEAQQLFTVSIRWLMDKYLRAPAALKAGTTAWESGNMAERRARAREFLNQVEELGRKDPQVFRDLGLEMQPAIETRSNQYIVQP